MTAKLGDELHTVGVVWRRNYAWDYVVDCLICVTGRLLASDGDIRAFVDDAGRVQFRPPGLVFPSIEEASRFIESANMNEVARMIDKVNA